MRKLATKMLAKIGWATIILLASACDRADDPLLASELIYEEITGNRAFGFQLDPKLALYPTIARAIREERLALLQAEQCEDLSTCNVESTVEMFYNGDRLVSLIEMNHKFYGGAHPSMDAGDMTFDLQTGQKIRFGDIFNSWPAARVILQREWCDAMREHSTCPPIEKQALALSGSKAGIDSIFVQTSDYAFGSYAEGPDKTYLSITPELIALAKPEYQSSFTLDVCC